MVNLFEYPEFSATLNYDKGYLKDISLNHKPL